MCIEELIADIDTRVDENGPLTCIDVENLVKFWRKIERRLRPNTEMQEELAERLINPIYIRVIERTRKWRQ